MTGRPTVSVVVPARDEEGMIEACLDALLTQDEPPEQIIVVDNDSTDSTARRVARYGRSVLSLPEPRPGIRYARSTGMDAATGAVIGRIDADTRLPPDWTTRVRAIFADPAVHAVTGRTAYYDIALPRLVALADRLLRRFWAGRDGADLDWIFGANMAVRREVWHDVRGSLCDDAAVHEDHDLGIHLHHRRWNVVYDQRLVAHTSARRIRDPFHAFRAYLLMTEHACRTHTGLVDPRSRWRAWATNRVILALYPSLRVLHALHERRVTRRRRGRPWRP